MSYKLFTALTIRTDSDRLPGKALRKVGPYPLATWIIRRLKKLPGKLVLATTSLSSDNELVKLAKKEKIDVYRDGEVDDVVGRIDRAMRQFMPDADYVFRGLGDCPFLEVAFVERSLDIMSRMDAIHFAWNIPPDVWPVYGSREFPYGRVAWNRINRYAVARLGEREHIDLHYNRFRRSYHALQGGVAYHEPPPPLYFRPRYRLEVDYEEDIQFLWQLVKKGAPGLLAPVKDVIEYLDEREDLHTINSHCVEKTGLFMSYDRLILNEWISLMRARPVWTWGDERIDPPGRTATKVFCGSRQCFIGYQYDGRLYTMTGDVITRGKVGCLCNAGKIWPEE